MIITASYYVRPCPDEIPEGAKEIRLGNGWTRIEKQFDSEDDAKAFLSKHADPLMRTPIYFQQESKYPANVIDVGTSYIPTTRPETKVALTEDDMSVMAFSGSQFSMGVVRKARAHSWAATQEILNFMTSSGTKLLADHKPEDGQLCEFMVMDKEIQRGTYHPKVSSRYYTLSEFFCLATGGGVCFIDPKETYWRGDD